MTKIDHRTIRETDPLKLSVAIPTSALSDESLKIDKTKKISVLARACAIFKIDTIYVYRQGEETPDGALITTILRYLETPQFLRKRLFPKVNDLKFAGALQPLRIPSHNTPANPKSITRNDIREGIVVSVKGRRFVDVGINQLIPLFGNGTPPGRRTTIQFREGYPNFSIKEIAPRQSPTYWGYAVRERASLYSLLSEWSGPVILTSRKGRRVTREHISKYTKSDQSTLVVFGSPEKGIHEIVGPKINKVQNAKFLNFFPDQATQTVRLEEALLGTLAIINMYNHDDG